MTKIDINTRLC